MNETPEPENTELVLPIVCPHCAKEINLAMAFSLLPPGEPISSNSQVGAVGKKNNEEEE